MIDYEFSGVLDTTFINGPFGAPKVPVPAAFDQPQGQVAGSLFSGRITIDTSAVAVRIVTRRPDGSLEQVGTSYESALSNLELSILGYRLTWSAPELNSAVQTCTRSCSDYAVYSRQASGFLEAPFENLIGQFSLEGSGPGPNPITLGSLDLADPTLLPDWKLGFGLIEPAPVSDDERRVLFRGMSIG
jgi:hypothetical protein